MINEYVNIRIPVKDGADITSEFQRNLKTAFIAMAGGAKFSELSESERESLAWIYTAEG